MRGISGRRGTEIADSIEAAVREGRLQLGERLPPVRELAVSLGVSTATVASAYRSLGDRGVLLADGRRGTTVRPRPPLSVPAPPSIPEGVRNLALGNPDPALLPDLRVALSGIRTDHRLYGESADLAELAALGRRAFEADGIAAGSMAIVSGALDGIERAIQAQLRPGDRVAIEDPGFAAVSDLVAACGLRAVPAAVDDAGLVPEGLELALRAGAEAVILTPRAQNPTGAALDIRRSRELGGVLDRHPRAMVIEDDFAGPIAGAAALTLTQGRERWIVVRSLSKSLGPDLRLAVLAGDEVTVARVRGRQALGAGWVSHLLQRLAVRLWRDPATRLLVERAARLYAERREALLEALRDTGLEAHGRSGLNVWVSVPEEGRVLRGLLAAGWAVAPGERFRHRSGPAIRITAATLAPEESRRLAGDLVASLGGGGGLTRPA